MLGTPVWTEVLGARCYASQRDAAYWGPGKAAGIILQGEMLDVMIQGGFGTPSYHLKKQTQGSANS